MLARLSRISPLVIFGLLLILHARSGSLFAEVPADTHSSSLPTLQATSLPDNEVSRNMLRSAEASPASLVFGRHAESDKPATPTPEQVVTAATDESRIAAPTVVQSAFETVYEDSEYQLDFHYPRDGWSSTVEFDNPGRADYVIRRRITLLGPNQARVVIDIWGNPAQLELVEWLERYSERLSVFADNTAEIALNAQVAGLPAMTHIQGPTSGSPGRVTTVVADPSHIFRFEYVAYDEGVGLTVYEQVLDSVSIDERSRSQSALPAIDTLMLAPNTITVSSCCGYPDEGNPYPCRADGETTDRGNCTWWAHSKRADWTHTVGWGDAKDWLGRAESEGYEVCRGSSCGAYVDSTAWWPAYDGCWTLEYGHVAHVERESPLAVSEMNWNSNPRCQVNTGGSPWDSCTPGGYIYGFPGEPVKLYEKAGFLGSGSTYLTPGSYNVPDHLNDHISSLSVQDGWAVRLYEHAIGDSRGRGRCLVLDSNILDLRNVGLCDTTTCTQSADDQISSIDVAYGACFPSCAGTSAASDVKAADSASSQGICSGGPTPPPPTPPPATDRVRLYALANYENELANYGAGFTNDPNANSYSMKIPNGWSVKTWSEDNQGGEYRCWSSSVANLQDHSWHLKIRSMEVFTSSVCPTAPPPGGQWEAKYWRTGTCYDDHSQCTDGNTTYQTNLGVPGNVGGRNYILKEDWGQNSPGGSTPTDEWTGKYVATINFNPGNYVFYSTHDDGLKFQIPGYGEWSTSDERIENQRLCPGGGKSWYLSGNTRIEAYLHERGGDATIQIWYDSNTAACVPPDAPTLWWPTNGGVTSDTTPTFDWLPVSGGTKYRLEVDNDMGFSDPKAISVEVTNDEYTPSTALGYGNYYWRVRSQNGYGNWSESWSSTWTLSIAPPAPNGIDASDGLYPDKVQVAWSAVSGATSYELYRASSYDGAKTKLTVTAGASYVDAAAVAGTLYYYWVKACSSTACSNYSVFDAGYSQTPPPTAITDLVMTRSLADGALTWSHSDPDVTHYQVYRSENPYFTPGQADSIKLEPDVAAPTSGTVVSYPGSALWPGVGVPNFYAVRAVNQFGAASMTSNRVGSFTFSLQSEGDPAPGSLLNGGFEDGSTAPAQWATEAWASGRTTFTWDIAHPRSGSRSIKIVSDQEDDARWIQTVVVQSQTDYRLSGCIKTENVAHRPDGTDAGASLSLMGGWIRSEGVFGTSDWTCTSVVFNTGTDTQVTVAARLGFYSGTTTGTAWFDDLRLEKMDTVQSIVVQVDADTQDGMEDTYFSISGDGAHNNWVGVSPAVMTGWVFPMINIPRGATITDAHIRTYGFGIDGSTTTRIYGFAQDFAPVFAADGSNRPSTRPTTAAYVDWPKTWAFAWQWIETPNFANVVQEIVNRSGWVSGNALGIRANIPSGMGTNWCSVDYAAGSERTTLYVTYSVP